MIKDYLSIGFFATCMAVYCSDGPDPFIVVGMSVLFVLLMTISIFGRSS